MTNSFKRFVVKRSVIIILLSYQNYFIPATIHIKTTDWVVIIFSTVSAGVIKAAINIPDFI